MKDKWEVGRKVKITKNLCGHEFNIGEIVDIIKFIEDPSPHWKVGKGNIWWWIREEEGVLIEDDDMINININGKNIDIQKLGKVTIDGYEITIKKYDSTKIKKGDLVRCALLSSLWFDYADHQHSDGEWVGKSNLLLGYEDHHTKKAFKATPEEIEMYNKIMGNKCK